jgi:hypothetical protein
VVFKPGADTELPERDRWNLPRAKTPCISYSYINLE